MSELHKRLLAAQSELKAPKGQFNKFGKYKYRSAEDILEAVKPVNKEHGLTLTLSDEPILIGEWHYIKATATVSHGEEQKEVTAYARESLSKKGMDDSQITGTASSYARKYALNGLYLIDDTKDADTDEYAEQGKQSKANAVKSATKQPIKATSAEISEYKNKLIEYATVTGNENDEGIRKVQAWGLGQAGADSFEKITKQGLTKGMNVVKAAIAKAQAKGKETLFDDK